MSNLQIFKNSEFGAIRTITKDGEPWFVRNDIAKALEYSESRVTDSKCIDAEDKGVAQIDTPYGIQEMIIINVSGLYSLIFSSKLPKAKEFKHWVTSEVLPSIRKTGTYSDKANQPTFTSQGEVANFIEVMRLIMKENNQSPEKIAEMAEAVQRQFRQPGGDC